MTKKRIGILGGMGPESTVLFYQSIIRECQKKYGAKDDMDYPEIVIYNLPIPNIVDQMEDIPKTRRLMQDGAKKLEQWGVDFMVIPCNAAHYFYEDVQKVISIPVLNIIDETISEMKKKGFEKAGLLAVGTTIKNKLYQKRSNDFILPEDQKKVDEIVLNILRGERNKSDLRKLQLLITYFISQGAESIVLGCTDFCALISKENSIIPLIDSTQILTEVTVAKAYTK